MSGNQAILDRVPLQREAVDTAATAPWRGPWLQLGSVKRFEWNRIELPIDSLPKALDGLRIVQLSDLHLKSVWHDGLDEVLERVADHPPDLIFLTGDFVDDKYDPRPALAMVDRFISGLRSRHGIYAIGGNHDGDLVLPRVASHGVTILSLGIHTVPIDGAPLETIGLAGLTRQDLQTQHLLDVPPRRQRVPRIVLSHYPDSLHAFQHHNGPPDLFIAGHTHGGQVCLPGGYPLLRHDTLPRRYCHGAHRVGDTWLVVSRGMGFSTHAIRVFCPAEVVEVVLKAEEKAVSNQLSAISQKARDTSLADS